jgi:hypothetical protein
MPDALTRAGRRPVFRRLAPVEQRSEPALVGGGEGDYFPYHYLQRHRIMVTV